MNFKNNPCEKHLDVSIDAHAGFCPICLFNERDAAIARAERAEAMVNKALREAVAAIYFDDNSDYLPALWSIVKRLGGEDLAAQLNANEQAVYDQICGEGG